MRFLIEINHPAHVHYYRNLANDLQARGHNIYWVVKDNDICKKLMDFYGLSYTILKGKPDNLIGKALMQLYYDYKLIAISKTRNINIALGTSISATHLSKIIKVKSFFFEDDDDEVIPLSVKIGHPFATHLLSPDCLKGKQKRKDVIYYPGYHELAYLHPKRFIPNPDVLQEFGIELYDNVFLVRFNVFKAHHDVGINGLSLDQKLQLIERLKPHGKIFITTERNIEPELKEFQLIINPEKIHSLMAYSTVFISESQTMTSEAAVLGVPSLRCNSFAGRLSTLEELEHKYGLTYAYQPTDFNKMLDKLDDFLSMPDLREEWQKRMRIMLEDKIDVTSFWTWFIDNYPESVEMIRDEEDFWGQFK